MKKLVMAFLMMVSSVAYSGELVLHVGSIHSESSYETKWTTTYVYPDGTVAYKTVDVTTTPYNNVNPGLGYLTDDGWTFGAYYNSYKKLSTYLAKEFMMNEYFGGFIGAATGYKFSTGHSVAPVGGLVFKLKIDEDYGVRVLALPPTGNTSGVVHLSLTKKF